MDNNRLRKILYRRLMEMGNAHADQPSSSNENLGKHWISLLMGAEGYMDERRHRLTWRFRLPSDE